MATLGTLKAAMASDLARSDLTSEIADQISRAITHYQGVRFYFNETRDETLNTVADQVWYDSTDLASIPNFLEFDGIYISVGGIVRQADIMDNNVFERLIDNSAASGEPTGYLFYQEKLGLYPIPSQAYTVRLTGHIKVAEPATDNESDNPWMTDAYQLIRYRALSKLYSVKIRNYERAAIMEREENESLVRLRGNASKRSGTGRVQATRF